jgi:hypothetical protein
MPQKPLVRAPVRSVVLVWLGWAVLILGFQALAVGRIDLARPDNALAWSAEETAAGRGNSSVLDAFVATHAAWDSKYYLSIAVGGYGDPAAPVVGPDSTPDEPQIGSRADHPDWPSVNAAFLPGYPAAIRALAWPLGVFGLPARTTAALAGIATSLLGTLGAMVAAFDLAGGRDDSGQGLRAAFYLVIWPGSIFLAQVYSEGLFLGLSLGALALMKRRRWPWAALLAAGAVWTRSTGVLLLIPFVWTWAGQARPFSPIRRPSAAEIAGAAWALSPALAYLAWRGVFGGPFDFVETHYFGRGLFWLGAAWDDWQAGFAAVVGGDGQAGAYRLFEFAAVGVALAASVALWRRDKALAAYGLAILAVAATSGAGLGMQRYALSIPALFLTPARLGRDPVFGQLWTLANVLGLALLAITFSFGFWTG